MKVTETSESVFIEDLPRLEWGRNMENTFIKSLQLTLNAMGEDISYDYLMGISGAAFRTQFHKRWCPSSADATVGFELTKPAFESLGNSYEFHHFNRRDPKQIEVLLQKIRPVVDHGIPVIAIDLKEVPDWGLICGYMKDKPELLCRTYFDEGEKYSVAENVPWVICIVKEKLLVPDEKEKLINSLKLAVKLAESRKVGYYLNGFEAYKYWINELGKHKKFSSRKKYEGLIQPNAWIYVSLIDSRQAAFNYLNEITDMLDGRQTDRIIANYNEIVTSLKANRSNVPFPRELKDGEWTQEMRNKQIESLHSAYDLEKQSVKLIRELIENDPSNRT